KLLQPLNREPHAVIGSSCIGAAVGGGVCNSSGGSLVARGPAHTELAVFARLGADGRLELVNLRGIELGDEPEDILGRLDAGYFNRTPAPTNLKASDTDSATQVRDIDAEAPARFNADSRR